MTSTSAPPISADNDYLADIRRLRLMQICLASLIGLAIAVLLAKNITVPILAAGIGCTALALALAFKQRVLLAAYVLLSALATMLCALAITGAGLFDLAILGYPSLLIFAAVLGSIGLFITVLGIIITQCIVLAWLSLHGVITPHIPSVTWSHLVFILIIFVITGFSVFLLVRDIKRLMLSLQRENSKVQLSKAKIQHLAHHDALTNLPNRLYGEHLFQQALNHCQQQQHQLALLFIDLDNFKPVNDALGHAAGDELLKQLALRLNASIPAGHHIIRFGGDEFLILAPCEDKPQLTELARQLIAQTTAVFTIVQTQVAVSASVGIACAPADGTDFKQLCRKADIAMYRAKEDGRNTFHFFDDSLDQANEDRFRLLQRLRQALSEQQFAIYLQPKIQLHSNKVTAVEALLRWPQADGSMIGPDTFIPLAESSGLINELGTWVLQQACLCCARMRQQGFSTLRIAVNLSVVQFNDGLLPERVQNALSAAGL
ncbi:MAG: diguanylate cyclase, partial [Rheinheimera sp.]|nr:diguanylate cyclase [Rheinheimera sp.]